MKKLLMALVVAGALMIPQMAKAYSCTWCGNGHCFFTEMGAEWCMQFGGSCWVGGNGCWDFLPDSPGGGPVEGFLSLTPDFETARQFCDTTPGCKWFYGDKRGGYYKQWGELALIYR